MRSEPVDCYYTPAGLAEDAMDALETSHPSSVADFACGDGRLLAAAQERFRRATMVGVDRDRRAIRRLRETHPRWILSVGDFLDAKSFSRSRA
jgi:trans-aconitate methyltransferase